MPNEAEEDRGRILPPIASLNGAAGVESVSSRSDGWSAIVRALPQQRWIMAEGTEPFRWPDSASRAGRVRLYSRDFDGGVCLPPTRGNSSC